MAQSSFFGDFAAGDPERNKIVEFPISAYLIEGPEGRILFDTGCNPDAMTVGGRWSEQFQNRFPWSGGEECQLPNRLEQLGLGPADIDWVVLSHMHSDHAGCVELFGKSQIIVHRDEMAAALDYHQRRDADSSYAWKDTAQWIDQDMNWRLIGPTELELPLTERVQLLNWGAGHSAGMLGLDVSLPDSGHIILTSDAVMTSENYHNPARPPGFADDLANAKLTVHAIRERASRTAAQVWYGHDLSQFLQLRHSAFGWYE